MTDRVDKAKRSSMMAAVRSKDTKPELVVRSLIFALGFRYRLHHKGLPGTPDLVFTRMRKVVFVHGCFWHRHPGCSMASMPQTGVLFWQKKFEETVLRDGRVLKELKASGWKALIIWQCELRDIERVARKLKAFLT
jgi:DNA mismatch endonuclease (patch repair protein)